MDWKEALEGLRELIDPLCTDDQFDYEKEIEKAIQAVEKQIPQKPVIKTVVYGEPCDALCPSCREKFPDIGGVCEALEACAMQNYCEHCGQRIDWSDWE
jgi:hypothetical protein